MVKRRVGIIIFLLCFCLYLMPFHVRAVSTADAREPISLDRQCSLTLSYSSDGVAFSDMPVKLYKIADVSDTCYFTLTSPFAGSGLILNGIQNAGEWNIIRSTLETYIIAYGLQADFTSMTNQAGQACFTSLKPGLYMAITENVIEEAKTYSFDSALINLPGLSVDGFWQYQVSVSAKPEITLPSQDEIQLKLLKLWKGEEEQVDRPLGIAVEIFRNGASYQTVVLSEENHWAYSWTAKDDGAKWVVIERNVPSGYTMTVEVRQTSFVLTNTLIPDGPDIPSSPPTGDTVNILFYVILMSVSGMVLLLLRIPGKRKHQ